MPDLIQTATWPGVASVAGCSGTLSHGITPATFVLTTYPQTARPRVYGDLVFSDGVRRVVLRDCKVVNLDGYADGEGQTWRLEIQDRRWRWRGLGSISGRYNQLDNQGKLVPWSIRSPEELARLCLAAVGERNYRLVLPPGLTSAAGRDLDRYLRLGENYPQTFANPPTVWDFTPPAEALARLADQWGCRVVYQPTLDRVLVCPLGSGRPLPAGPCEVIAPGVSVPAVPAAVGVAGAPVRVQCRLALEPVGEEWDGSYRPIDELSYAPPGEAARPQIATITYAGEADDDASLQVVVNGVSFTESGTDTPEDKVQRFAARVGAHPALAPALTAAAAGRVLTLRGREPGKAFAADSSISTAYSATFATTLVQSAAGGNEGRWARCPAPGFPGVVPTVRLSRDEAIGLARKSVWRCFRVKLVDPATGAGPLSLPWYGPVQRRQQVVLQPTKAEQVAPQPRLAAFKPPATGPTGPVPSPVQGVIPEFYNGYSRDQQATVTGAIAQRLVSVFWTAKGAPNTPAGSRVLTPFVIDPVEQLVVFSGYVFKDDAGSDRVLPPDLILETAVLVQRPDTSEVVRWTDALPLGGAAPVEWAVFEDVQVCAVGGYDANNRLTGAELLFIEDAKGRARYYLEGMAAKYRLTGGETRQYVGIYPIDPDGAVQQVTWSVGGEGATTVAGLNTEFSPVIPPYPARRKAENLAPSTAAALANLSDRVGLDAVLPGRLIRGLR